MEDIVKELSKPNTGIRTKLQDPETNPPKDAHMCWLQRSVDAELKFISDVRAVLTSDQAVVWVSIDCSLSQRFQ